MFQPPRSPQWFRSAAAGLLFLVFQGAVAEPTGVGAAEPSAKSKPNVLIITVDDMNCDSVGAFGCELPGTTPHIDALAASGLRYAHAHVQVGNCYPSRNVMFSGRYPHNTGVEGFYQVKDARYPHLVDLMHAAGYFVGIRGKVRHSTPYQPYAWDADLTVLGGKRQHPKNVDSYYASTRRGIALAQQAGKPFCLNINISDPHKPFYAMSKAGKVVDDPNVPSRIFSPDEVPIPGFLFDDPDVRLELAHYYSSVRRADDCVAAILKALDESGQSEDTVVIFLSDHGMPLPFAKTALWHHSTRTPLIVRWPGVTEAGAVDRQHMVSAVDLLPTIVDLVGLTPPTGFDGRSFAPTLRGQTQADRAMVFKVYNENSGGHRHPMRSVETKRFGYLFNPWSDGKRVFRTATQGTLTFRAMKRRAPSDATIAARLEHFLHNTPEEFYDYQRDPDARHNLIDDPAYAEHIERLRAAMRRFMVETGDHALEAFDHRDDPEAMSRYVERVQAESDKRRQRKRRGRAANRPPRNPNLFQLQVPQSASPGQPFVVTVNHDLPKALGEQQFHVTIKDADGARLQRIVKRASGEGTLEVTFRLSPRLTTEALRVASFVGESFPQNRLHRTQGPVRVTDSAGARSSSTESGNIP